MSNPASHRYISELQKLGDFLVEELGLELTRQGHNNTGKLIESLRARVVVDTDNIILEIYTTENYANVVNTGFSAERTPYQRSFLKKSGGTSLYIQGLMKWIQQRGLERGQKNIKNMAFAIANKHAKEGMPTKSSLKFSSTGKRTGFIEEVIPRNEEHIADIVFETTEEIIDITLDAIVKRNNAA